MSQSILRLGMTSPTAARAFIMSSSSTIKPGKSILRRPTALPLSPSAGALPFAASFSVHLSPASPHVRFPPSPSLIDGTITAHSANSYDRAPIKVSPNPVALPKRHTRIYSPSMEAFKLNSPPKATIAARRARRRASKSIMNNPAPDSPAIVGFEDPRSPKPRAEAGQGIRFAPFAAVSSRQPRDLGRSLSSYPRSPYPSAPLSPQGIPWPSKDVDVIGQRTRAHSNEERKMPSRQHQHRSAAPFTPIPSPLNQSFVVPMASARRPAPLDLAPTQDSEELSNAFWQSMTLESADSDGAMVTALEYPSSASALDVPMSALSQLPARVSLMFGGKDGALWSPQFRPEGILSPGRKTVFNGTQMKRSYIASPSPHDPFAAFPSFSVALQKGDSVGAVAYPPRAVLEGF